MADDYLQLVKDKEDENNDLNTRMDDDRDLVNLSSYTIKGIGDTAIKNVVNVTLNKPAVFAANVESALNSAIEQVNVISEDNKVDTDTVADCVRAAFGSAESLNRLQGGWPLNPWIDQMMCRRGGAGVRVLFSMQDTKDANGKAVRQGRVNLTQLDRRYLSYDIGENGVSWYGYRTTRSRAAILAEYPDLETKLGTKKSGEIVDFWNEEVNAVYLDNALIFEQANTLGYPPLAIQTVTLGSMLADDDNREYEGESIFFLIRGVIPELNRLVSMMQTLNMIGIKPPKEWQSQDGVNAEAPDYDEAIGPGRVISSEIGGGFKNIDFGDLKNSAVYALEVIDKAITQGSLDVVDIGSIPSGGLSAVALIEIGEGRDQVFLPRLAARGFLKQQIADMLISQILASGESSVQLGTKGRARTFQVSKLQGEYEVEYNYFVKSPKTDIARYEIGMTAKQLGMADEDIWKEIIQHPQHEEILKNANRERVRMLSPRVDALYRIKMLSESDDEEDQVAADMLAAELGMDLDALESGNAPALPGTQPTGQQPPDLNGLMTAMTKPNSAKEAANLQQKPRGMSA